MKKLVPLVAILFFIGLASISAEEPYTEGIRDHDEHKQDVRDLVAKKKELSKLNEKQLRELRAYLHLFAKELDNGDRAKPYENLADQLHLLWCENTLFKAKQWAKDKRVDLLIDFAPMLKTEKQAEKLLPEFLSIGDPLVKDLQALYKEVKDHSLITTANIEKRKEKTEIKIVDEDKHIGHEHHSDKYFLKISPHGKLSRSGYNHTIFIVPEKLETPDKRKYFWIDHSLIFTNSSIEPSTLWQSILIADGDVHFEVHSDVEKSVVITNGNIMSKSSPVHGKSVFCANGRLEYDKLGRDNTLFEKQRAVPDKDFQPSIVKSFEKHPYGIRWFDLSEVGATVSTVLFKRMLLMEKGLQLDKLTKDSPLAKQGLKEKDIILEVHGEKPRDADHFRKLVRLAGVREFAVFTIDRDGKKLKFMIYFDDLFTKK